MEAMGRQKMTASELDLTCYYEFLRERNHRPLQKIK